WNAVRAPDPERIVHGRDGGAAAPLVWRHAQTELIARSCGHHRQRRLAHLDVDAVPDRAGPGFVSAARAVMGLASTVTQRLDRRAPVPGSARGRSRDHGVGLFRL